MEAVYWDDCCQTSSLTNLLPTYTFRPAHKRTLTPAPEPEPKPILQPLRPAKVRTPLVHWRPPSHLWRLKGTVRWLTTMYEYRLLWHLDLVLCLMEAVRVLWKSTIGSLTSVFQWFHDQERKKSSVPAEYRGNRSSQARWVFPTYHATNQLMDMTMIWSTSVVSGQCTLSLYFSTLSTIIALAWTLPIRTNYADGPGGVTQCPIIPGNLFLYDFSVLDQAGMFWYHAHHCRLYFI